MTERIVKREIESYLEGWSPSQSQSIEGLGGIVPHAGWYFSGKLAVRVFYSLKLKRKVEVVVLYGGHLSSESLPQIVTEETWETPFGDIEIHTGFVKSLMKRIDSKKESPSSGDNTIEVQLAMVKYFFPEAKLLALRSPASLKAKELGEAVAETAQDRGNLNPCHWINRSHPLWSQLWILNKGVGPSAVEWVKKENDRGFIDRALRMDIEGLLKHAEENDSACSAGAAASAMATCKALGAKKGVLLDYYTSYEIIPDDSFVGYAGIVFKFRLRNAEEFKTKNFW